MERGKRTETDLANFADGRDENNLAEFPVALLSDSAPADQKTIEFEDTLTDWSTGKEIVRRVCITGSDKFGLPTAKDEDVLLALLQLTKLANNFTTPEVWFNKHQVIEILGWKNRGWAYDRVEESLHRWKGVSIHYWNAWRDKARDAWCDSAAIGVIEYFALTDGRRNKSADDGPAGMSRFAWNKIFFESFEAGYLKKLDFATYRQLQRQAAKRAFRFLDKRFFHESDWEFDLREFACEKLGFSRAYNTGQLKERLRPALGELENIGFIEPVRYRKECPKVWKLAIAKKASSLKEARPESTEPVRLVAELVRRGVENGVATELEASFPAERIAEKLRYVDWLLARGDKRVAKNPAGFLVAAIRGDYPLPKDYLRFLKASGSERGSRRNDSRSENRAARGVQCHAEQGAVAPEPNAVQVYLASLSGEETARLEFEAVAAAAKVEAASYARLKGRDDQLFAGVRKHLLEKYVLTHGLHLKSSVANAA